MKAATLIFKNALQAKKNLDAIEKKRVKAAETATKVEGFRLSKKLKREIRAGAPGGQAFSPLSVIARKIRRSKKPLAKLAIPVRYRATRTAGKFNVEVGFVDPGRGPALSKSWKRIAQKQQEGFVSDVSDSRRLFILRIGTGLGKRSKMRKYMLLKKSTRRFKTPARPIIDPFWNAHRSEAQRNIVKNWERKMAGERI